MTRWGLVAALCGTVAWAQPLALVVGENHGLSNEDTLRFAEVDAVRVADALTQVSGFQPADVLVLKGATSDSLREALRQLQGRLSQAHHERLLIYVSSHAGEGSLHLAGTRFPLDELVDFVKHAPVEVGLLVLDACRSGSVTRLKGLKPSDLPPTHIEAIPLEGRVFISASGADEYAQESDALGGSTFTHHWLTGLRGAADTSGDGRVTLDEVYAWAWARTIEATFGSRAGVQRPTFSVDLRGQGQLVLSTPGTARSRLILALEPPGRWLVVSVSTNVVLADVEKPRGPLTLALPPGEVRVRLRTHGEVLERTLTVPVDGEVTVRDLEASAFQTRVAAKGEAEVSWVWSAGGGVSSGLLAGLQAEPGGVLRVRRDAHLLGPLNQLSVAVEARGATSIGAVGFSHVEVELRLGAGRRFTLGAASLTLALELGPLLASQWHLPGEATRSGLALVGDVALEVRLALVGPLEVVLTGTAGGVLLKKAAAGQQGVVTVAPRVGLTGGLALAF